MRTKKTVMTGSSAVSDSTHSLHSRGCSAGDKAGDVFGSARSKGNNVKDVKKTDVKDAKKKVEKDVKNIKEGQVTWSNTWGTHGMKSANCKCKFLR